MSVRKLTTSLLFALATLGLFAPTVQGQEYIPVADPFEFDPDFRWFEPMTQMDFEDMKPRKRANTGWFATYDRLNLYGSRPEIDDARASETQLDSGWGHRYELGYMMPDVDKGWLFTYTENGVAGFNSVVVERLNRVNTDELDIIGGGGDGGDLTLAPPFGFIVPDADRNTPGFNQRLLFINDAENVFTYDSYELNKTWRMTPYHYGGILEPLVGIRWIRVNDTNQFQNYTSSADIDLIPFTTFGDAERIITDLTQTENEILAGQVGFRYTKFRDRFTFSSDCRLFTGASWQNSKTFEATDIVVYDGTGINAAVDQYIHRETTPINTRNEEFSIGFDIRGEIAYQLTRSFSVRAGFQFIDIASGVWRGGPQDPSRNQLPGGDTDQDLVQFGSTFGLTINR